ncbi:hypothetical protein [Mycolicibacterium aubagnense]|uniref:Uncharacterized protein n=1 Tax=Mycolicibacterium aubagnense TaxID=319707 RepID=A0ABN5YP91_9MYCO|nr:hypothetical protein [Mycolicibacterium aubagnense]WGI34574.1 hypothetical protein QDT91_09645 [Mycolicibacterium aubagnense]BBX83549.1 hypothetical protein MAUB_14220 [Mycolicibacterium aubagnense]
MPGSIRRVSGTRGKDDGLIELRLVGHPHLYRVRVQMGSGAPKLVELHLLPADDDAAAEIDPATIRNVPVRRLANAAARWIACVDGSFIGVKELRNPTLTLRPERPADGGKRRKLDDIHYRQVADLLIAARTIGEPPRKYVRDQLGPASVATVDRWIAEAKERKFLPRDWATNDAATADPDQEN